MGNYFSKFFNDQTSQLNATINRQSKCIRKLKNKIQLLEYKENSKHYLKNGIISPLDKDITESIEETKDKKTYKYLVLSGGGMKGLSYCGAIDVLEDKSILKNIKGFAGSSAGAITASLLAVGYNAKELQDIIFGIDYSKIIDDKWGVFRDAINIVEDFGLAPGDYFIDLMGKIIEKKTGNKDYTINDLYKDKGITLVITGTDINHKKTIYFCPNKNNKINKSHHGDIPIRKAVRISMSIPFLFEPVTYDGCMCVDGGVLDNYPLHVFDGEYPGDQDARLNQCPPNHEVLGLNIMTSDEIGGYDTNIRDQIDNFWEYSVAYLNLFLKENDRRMMTPSYWKRTINIITPDIPLTKFDLSDKEKYELVDRGKEYTEYFFSNSETETI